MKSKLVFVSVLLTLSFAGILAIFWYQESQYLLPTPIPSNYQLVAAGKAVHLPALPGIDNRKPLLLHFFNPDCPCSRFNIEHFRKLMSKYQGRLQFYAVLHTTDENETAEKFQKKYELGIPVISNTDHRLAIACGVYATPQAAIIDQDGKLYFRGNYNKSRYCTDANSNFAQMAIDSLLASKPSPDFIELATTAYGCQLPD